MRIFFTADLHLGHTNILKYQAHTRKYDNIDEHDGAIIKAWNATVGINDTCYILGDLGMNIQHIENILKKLNGNKVLVRGNHDKFTPNSLYRIGFSAVIEECKIRLNKNHLVKASHYPYHNPDDCFERKFKELRPIPEDMWLLHGHTHSNSPKVSIATREINVGWDWWKRPVSNFELINIIETSQGDIASE